MIRKSVLGTAAALGAALMVACPTSATAASPEFNFAVAAPEGPPPAPQSTCKSSPIAKVCYEPNRDRIWLKNTKSGSTSTYTDWAILGGRYGQCGSKVKVGTWAVCAKDFPERQTIQLTFYASSQAYVIISTT